MSITRFHRRARRLGNTRRAGVRRQQAFGLRHAGQRHFGRVGLPIALLAVCAGTGVRADQGAAPATAAPKMQRVTDAGAVFIAPAPDAVLDVPAATITLEYPTPKNGADGEGVQLRVNGLLVDSALVGRTETDGGAGTTTRTWVGVSLREGENLLAAYAPGAKLDAPLATRKLMVRGAAQRIVLKAMQIRLPADGRSVAILEGELRDAQGSRSGRDAIVTLTASGGELVGDDADTDEPGLQIMARQGRFTVGLRAGITAGRVRVRAQSGDMEAFTQIEFLTALRPSLVAGVLDARLGGRGLHFADRLPDLYRPDATSGTPGNLYSALFAVGAINKWLITGAYNSAHPINERIGGQSSLYRDIQPNESQYPVYGDSSGVHALAQSQDHLFVRVERNRDFAQWGDYDTLEMADPSQQFTATTRQFHGLKTNLNAGRFTFTGYYGDNVQGFQRDTIAPDGTSGFYFLSRRPLVIGSENVFVEAEELNRPGTVLSRQPLGRTLDYEIDYDRGTILFKRPQLRTDVSADGTVLVRRVVVTYQYESQGGAASAYGSRLRYTLRRDGERESWLGATYLNDNQGSRQFALYGADALLRLPGGLGLIGEAAHSQSDSDLLGAVGGSAYRFELTRQPTRALAGGGTQLIGLRGAQGRVYYQATDTGFVNNATLSYVPGQSRWGAQLAIAAAAGTGLRFQYDEERNRGVAPRPLTELGDLLNAQTDPLAGSRVDNLLRSVSLGVQQRAGSAQFVSDVVYRKRDDATTPALLGGSSCQVESRLTAPLARALTFRAENTLSLTARPDVVFPDRSTLGLDWAIRKGIGARLAQTFFSRGQYAGQNLTSLETTGEYKPGANTDLHTRFGIAGGINGLTAQGSVGLGQRLIVARGLSLNLAYEHVRGDLLGVTAAGQTFAQPFVAGQGASSLGVTGGTTYGAGLEYTRLANFKASARWEARANRDGHNTVITGAATGKLTPELTVLFRFQQANSANQRLGGLDDSAVLRLGLAWRDPRRDAFNALLRYDYRRNLATTPESLLEGSGLSGADHTFALEAVYAPNWRWETYGKFGVRASQTRLAQDYTGGSTLLLAQGRVAYHLGDRWDVAGEMRWIGQARAQYQHRALALEVGCYVAPDLRLAAGYGWGHSDDGAFAGGRVQKGVYAGITLKVNRLFSGFGLQRPTPTRPHAQPPAADFAPMPNAAGSPAFPAQTREDAHP